MKIALSFFTIALAPWIVFLSLELLVRIFDITSLSSRKVEPQYQSCEPRAGDSYRLSVTDSGQKKTKYTQLQFEPKNLVKNYDFFATDDRGYVFHKEKESFRQQARIAETDEFVYDVTYGFDEGGRRRVPGSENILAQLHLVLNGCSVVFGEGLNDQQTLAAHMQKHFQETKVYNLGRVGGSVVDAVSTLETTQMWQDITPPHGVLLLYHAQHTHVPRFQGAMMTIGGWRGQAAFLEESKSSGEFKFGGVYYRDKLVWTWLSQWAIKSKLLKAISFDWPPQTDSALDSYTRALVFLRKKYQRKTSQDNPMVVYLKPGDKESCKIIPFLEKHHIYYLDYTNWYVRDFATDQLAIQYDGHPTVEYNKILALQLAHDLKFQENEKKLHRKLF